MRPFTADESFLTQQLTTNPHNRSISSRYSYLHSSKQIRNLIQTNNFHSFLQSPSIPNDTNNLSSIKTQNYQELHMELTAIHTDFNKRKKRYSFDDSRLKELRNLTREKILEEKTAEKKLSNLNFKLVNLQNLIKNIEKQQEECFESMQVNYHILDRSKQNRVFLEKKTNALKSQLRKIKYRLEGEIKENFKEKQHKICSQRVYKALNSLADSKKTENQLAVKAILKDLRIREFFKEKRDERIRKNIEISEQVANDAKDKKEIKLREGVLMYKLLEGLLSSKLSEMKKKHSNVEEAFMKIRIITGETNVLDLVQKFLTHESTFKDLQFTIDISRKSIEEFHMKNNEIEKIINAATVQDKEPRNSEIYKLKEKHMNALKILESEQLRLHDMKIVYRHIIDWHKRICLMLRIETNHQKLFEKFQDLGKLTTGLIRSKSF